MKQINQLPLNEFKLIVDNTETLCQEAWDYGTSLMWEDLRDVLKYFSDSIAEYNIGYPADYITVNAGDEIQFLKDLAEADCMLDILGMEDGLLIERLIDREDSLNAWNYGEMSEENSERFDKWFFGHFFELKDKLLEVLKSIEDHYENNYLDYAYEDNLFDDDLFIGDDGKVYTAAFLPIR